LSAVSKSVWLRWWAACTALTRSDVAMMVA
jgi:hypothetical protein